MALGFVWHARRSDEPFLPLPLMGGSVVPYAMAAGGCALGAMLGLTVHMPLYYEAVYHLSASESGLALIPLAAVSTGGAAIATGALNFFRALAAAFTVAAFTAILLMALGAEVSLVGEQRSAVSGIAPADMVTAFRYVFAAAAVLMAGAALLMVLMEQKPLAGPATVPAEMAE